MEEQIRETLQSEPFKSMLLMDFIATPLTDDEHNPRTLVAEVYGEDAPFYAFDGAELAIERVRERYSAALFAALQVLVMPDVEYEKWLERIGKCRGETPSTS